VRRWLLAAASVTGYVGPRVYKFRLLERVSGEGRRAIVVRRSNDWARPDSVQTPENPIVLVEVYADETRNPDGTIKRSDAEDNCLAVYRAVDPLLHGLRGMYLGAVGTNPGLMVVSSQRWSEPILQRANELHMQDERRYSIGDGALLTAAYAMQVAAGSGPRPSSTPQAPAAPVAPGGGSQRMEFVQSTPAATWTIVHNFGMRPLVEIYDVSGEEIDADVIHSSLNVVTIVHGAPLTGSVVLTV
jgi:hypothetical protein